MAWKSGHRSTSAQWLLHGKVHLDREELSTYCEHFMGKSQVWTSLNVKTLATSIFLTRTLQTMSWSCSRATDCCGVWGFHLRPSFHPPDEPRLLVPEPAGQLHGLQQEENVWCLPAGAPCSCSAHPSSIPVSGPGIVLWVRIFSWA